MFLGALSFLLGCSFVACATAAKRWSKANFVNQRRPGGLPAPLCLGRLFVGGSKTKQKRQQKGFPKDFPEEWLCSPDRIAFLIVNKHRPCSLTCPYVKQFRSSLQRWSCLKSSRLSGADSLPQAHFPTQTWAGQEVWLMAYPEPIIKVHRQHYGEYVR